MGLTECTPFQVHTVTLMVQSCSCAVVPIRQPVHNVHIPKSSPCETLHVDVTQSTAHTLLAATHQVRAFGSCLENPNKLTDYEDLADGVLVYEVLLQIDPEPAHHGVLPSFGNALVRTRNMDIVIKNMKALYEEELCQVLLVLPDCVKLGREPESKTGIENMHLLLLLLLGCAVQCPNKETFIDRYQTDEC
ncbi:unnamed protein product [Timema podura]|uniref:HOOK N-terminal domain-containing protein n=1 Tax=Timema podura TaxID=61482 RepID=A0ABN7PGL6_TIMPD|nr:unnamed protein product [Timema podura]